MLHSAALEGLIEFKQRQKSTANGALNGLSNSTSCAHFPHFSLSLFLVSSLSLARSLLHLPFFHPFNSFPFVRGQFPRLSADAGRLSLGNLYYLFLFFFKKKNINIPILSIILNYYFRPSRRALSDKAFFLGLSGVISFQSPSSCSPALPFSLPHCSIQELERFSRLVAVKFVRRVSFPAHRVASHSERPFVLHDLFLITPVNYKSPHLSRIHSFLLLLILLLLFFIFNFDACIFLFYMIPFRLSILSNLSCNCVDTGFWNYTIQANPCWNAGDQIRWP